MKSGFYFPLILIFILLGCEKDTEPDINNKASVVLNLEIIYGDGQTGVYNSVLSDSLVVKVTDKKGFPVSQTPVSFEQMAGSGHISPVWVLTDDKGLAYTKWTIGCNSNYNELRAYVSDSISNKIDSVTFTSNAYLPKGWGKSCGIGYTDMFGSHIREHNGILYLNNYDMIYTSGDGGISWEKYDHMPQISTSSYIYDIQFNSKGWMYVTTENDGIFYSDDYQTWHQINNGIMDPRYPQGFLVEDSCIFVSFYFDGLYKSADNGQSWKKILINDIYAQQYVFITRHPNGDLYMFDKQNYLWHSTDNGESWSLILLDYKYIDYEVESFTIGNNGVLYIGAGNATLSALSTLTYQGTIHSFYKENSSMQAVQDIQVIDDVIYFTVNGSPEPGIYSSQSWSKLDLNFKFSVNSYYLKSDGTFLIVSGDGVYYYNKE